MYSSRTNQAIIYQSFNASFVTALLGPRRVGKSTLVSEFARQSEEQAWAFFNMDKLTKRDAIKQRGLASIIEEQTHRKLGSQPKIWIAIDEAQKCPLLFEQIKVIYDQYKHQDAVKFILTGSGSLDLHQLSAETLAGRIELFYLQEFNLRETVTLQNQLTLPNVSSLDLIINGQDNQLTQVVEACSPFRRELNHGLEEQLLWGGLPEVLKLQETAHRLRYLSYYLQTYLEKDIRAITTINDLNLYQKLIEIIAEQTGSLRQDKRIIDALACSRDTLKKYRGYLAATLIYQEIYPFINNPLQRLVKSPKAYLLNNGLISYLTGIHDFKTLQSSGMIGHRLENWFLKELNIALTRSSQHSKIYYWRTAAGAEVDFIIHKKPVILPFEVTVSKQIQTNKLSNLRHFMQANPQASKGFYIYMGEFKIDDNIYFIPAWLIC
ncbi:MAG: AAA family ATPase [Gammaproteobacteria bacterium]